VERNTTYVYIVYPFIGNDRDPAHGSNWPVHIRIYCLCLSLQLSIIVCTLSHTLYSIIPNQSYLVSEGARIRVLQHPSLLHDASMVWPMSPKMSPKMYVFQCVSLCCDIVSYVGTMWWKTPRGEIQREGLVGKSSKLPLSLKSSMSCNPPKASQRLPNVGVIRENQLPTP
jgi:hypothetical protein